MSVAIQASGGTGRRTWNALNDSGASLALDLNRLTSKHLFYKSLAVLADTRLGFRQWFGFRWVPAHSQNSSRALRALEADV
jgi:hypothetical protein